MAAMAADVEDFDEETDLASIFLNSVLEKAEYICQRNVERRIVERVKSVTFNTSERPSVNSMNALGNTDVLS